MNKFVPKVALLTQGQLIRYQGSEMVTLELAEELSKLGTKVIIFTNIYDCPIKKEFEEIKNVHVFTNEDKLAKKGYRFDFIWVHHQILPKFIIDQINNKKERPFVVFHHMSSFFPLEYPYSGLLEAKLADLVLYNSLETKKAIKAKGFETSPSSELILNNPAPNTFYLAGNQRKYSQTLNKILFVSNHMQEEVKGAKWLLEKDGIKTKTIGLNTVDGNTRVSPNMIKGADVVVANGKTVQYAILTGTPVYCYDIFGGPGYLKKSNIIQAGNFHYSGKNFSFKSPEEIASEIIKQYPQAIKDAPIFREKNKNKYSLSCRLSELFDRLASTDKTVKKITQAEIGAHLATQELVKIYSLQIRDLRSCEGTKSPTNNAKKVIDDNNRLKQELASLYSSKTWRYTKPIRATISQARKLKNKN